MKLLRVLLIACALLAACASIPPAASPTGTVGATAGVPAAPDSSPEFVDHFQVEAWVNDPTPDRDDRVIVSGSLIKNGVYLGGMMMQATWPDETQQHGEPNCNVLVIYQRGVCVIEAGQFPPGEFVPVHISFLYQDVIYSADTGFTPK